MKYILFSVIGLVLLSVQEIELNKVFEFSETNKELILTNQKIQNSHELIGLNKSSEKVKSYFATLGRCEIRNYDKDRTDFDFIDNGILFRFDLEENIKVIFFSNYKTKDWTNKSFKGELPFGIEFSDSLETLTVKLGEGNLWHRHGFYGRIFEWFVQDKFRLTIELELPRNENEKVFIETIGISKK